MWNQRNVFNRFTCRHGRMQVCARMLHAVALFNHHETCVRKLLRYPAVLCLTYPSRLMYAFRVSAHYIRKSVFIFELQYQYTLRSQHVSKTHYRNQHQKVTTTRMLQKDVWLKFQNTNKEGRGKDYSSQLKKIIAFHYLLILFFE